MDDMAGVPKATLFGYSLRPQLTPLLAQHNRMLAVLTPDFGPGKVGDSIHMYMGLPDRFSRDI